MTYVREALAAVHAEIPRLNPELARYYALLTLTRGEETSMADVHNAWAIRKDTTRPDHWSIRPYCELRPEVQLLDEPYMEGIRRAARRLVLAGVR